MATTLKGTNIISTIRPVTSEDKYAVAYANELKGGLHTASSTYSMYQIPKERREIGMIVVVNNEMYRLETNRDTDITAESDWVKLETTTDDLSVTVDGELITITEAIERINTASKNRFIQFVNYVGSDKRISLVEMILPFTCKVKSITCAVPYNTELSEDLPMQLQVYSDKTWQTVLTCYISKSTNSGSAAKEEAVEITAGDRIRMINKYGESQPISDDVDSISTTVCIEF